jgi:hypothetical protein
VICYFEEKIMSVSQREREKNRKKEAGITGAEEPNQKNKSQASFGNEKRKRENRLRVKFRFSVLDVM